MSEYKHEDLNPALIGKRQYLAITRISDIDPAKEVAIRMHAATLKVSQKAKDTWILMQIENAKRIVHAP